VLETTTSKGEEIFIIGVFGQVDQALSNILVLLVHLIVNLELKRCQFGKQFVKLLMQPIDRTHLQFYFLMKDTEADLEH
jgi:hypothetical protein